MATIYQRVDDRNMRWFKRQLSEFQATGGRRSNPFNKLTRQWANIYGENMRTRHISMSRGGSWHGKKWKRITQEAQEAKLYAVAGRSAILIDSGKLRNAHSSGAPGHLERIIPGGVQVGFDDVVHTAGVTKYGQLAKKHHYGDALLPKRPVLDAPNQVGEYTMINAVKHNFQNVIVPRMR